MQESAKYKYKHKQKYFATVIQPEFLIDAKSTVFSFINEIISDSEHIGITKSYSNPGISHSENIAFPKTTSPQNTSTKLTIRKYLLQHKNTKAN